MGTARTGPTLFGSARTAMPPALRLHTMQKTRKWQGRPSHAWPIRIDYWGRHVRATARAIHHEETIRKRHSTPVLP